MRYLYLLILSVTLTAHAQLLNTLEVSEKLSAGAEAEARTEILQTAVMKSIEKFAPELGVQPDTFKEKLDKKFDVVFGAYKERTLIQKYSSNYKTTLSPAELEAASKALDQERVSALHKFIGSKDLLRSHSFKSFFQDEKDPSVWKAKVDVDLDKPKLEKLFQKIVSEETKPYSKVYLISDVTPLQFSWKDLGLESEASFKKPLNESWLKWLNDHLPSTVEEIIACDAGCMQFYLKWSETQVENLIIPDEFHHSAFLNVNVFLRRKSVENSLKEEYFEWEGRALIQDVTTKRTMGSSTLPLEYRRFRAIDQKLLNSSLASSIYKTPMPAFMDFNKKLEEKAGVRKSVSRSSKLVIQGYKNISDVKALNEVLKARGKGIGLEISLDSFSKDKAQLVCYYHGEEKSFTDLLSSIKELKSSHKYVLVNEFTGVHHVLKLVTE